MRERGGMDRWDSRLASPIPPASRVHPVRAISSCPRCVGHCSDAVPKWFSRAGSDPGYSLTRHPFAATRSAASPPPSPSRCCRPSSPGRSTRCPARRSTSASSAWSASCPPCSLSFVSGVVVDTYDRRRVLLGAQAVPAVTSALMLVALATGNATLPLVYGLVFFAGVASAFEGPARQTLIPALVPRNLFSRAMTLQLDAAVAVVGQRPGRRRHPDRLAGHRPGLRGALRTGAAVDGGAAGQSACPRSSSAVARRRAPRRRSAKAWRYLAQPAGRARRDDPGHVRGALRRRQGAAADLRRRHPARRRRRLRRADRVARRRRAHRRRRHGRAADADAHRPRAAASVAAFGLATIAFGLSTLAAAVDPGLRRRSAPPTRSAWSCA